MNTLYFHAFSGAAGDMIVAALLDAGAPIDYVREQLDGLRLDDWELDVSKVQRGGISATYVQVTVKDAPHARTYDDIMRILDEAALDPRVGSLARRIFTRLAGAEARVHDVPIGSVHLHEVGSTDAIVDVVASSAALTHFAGELVVTSPLPLGSGTVEAAHGSLPVPAPAVVELLRDAPVRAGGSGEMVTPTGAAILAEITHHYGEMPPMILRSTGYGAGTRDVPGVPNVLRVLVGERTDADGGQDALVAECNIDDMTPELFPYIVERLFEAGASDAWITPIVMKKGRPAFTLSVLVDAHIVDPVLDAMYRETSSLGIRVHPVRKHPLDRTWITTEVAGARVRVKVGMRNGERLTWSPEHDDAVAAAAATGLPLKEIYRRALVEAEKLTAS